MNSRPIPALTDSDLRRFWVKVNKTEGCWLWTAALTKGYACFVLGGRKNRQLVYGHRLAYTLERGPIPAGMVLDHLCYTPACVRPDHLEVVTQGLNARRGRQVYANGRTQCRHGHDMTDETNTYTEADGYLKCRTCKRAREAARYARQGNNYDPAKRRDRYLRERGEAA